MQKQPPLHEQAHEPPFKPQENAEGDDQRTDTSTQASTDLNGEEEEEPTPPENSDEQEEEELLEWSGGRNSYPTGWSTTR